MQHVKLPSVHIKLIKNSFLYAGLNAFPPLQPLRVDLNQGQTLCLCIAESCDHNKCPSTSSENSEGSGPVDQADCDSGYSQLAVC